MPDCTLSEIANVNPTRTLSKGCIAKCYDMSCLPTRGCVPEGGEMKAYNGGVRFQNGDTLIARITPCLENGKAAYINILNDKEVAFGSTEYIVFSPIDTMPSSFYYFLIRSKKFRAFSLQYMNGSSGRQRVSGDELAAFPLTKPSQEALSRFDMVAAPVLERFKVASLEINRLNALQQLIIASISSR
jgi:type I restriction enzyme S subunit